MPRRFLLLLLLLIPACQAPLLDSPRSQWFLIGEASFTREPDGVIHGVGRDLPRNSFLVSQAQYSDFELEVDLKIDGGNSGIQIRSQLKDEGTKIFGYQIEVDPSERAWSGGLYDEARRGWLDSNEGKPDSLASFQVNAWNHYRIRCEGTRIQSWVNGVPCTDFLDDVDSSGHIGLQVHGGAKTDVWWRGLKITPLP